MDSTKTLDENITSAIALVISRITLPPQIDKDDLAQECWVQVLRTLRAGDFDAANAKAFNYICTLARNEIMNYLKADKASLCRQLEPECAELMRLPDHERRAEDEDREHWLGRLSSIMPQLTDTETRMIQLYYQDQLGMRDAAKRLGWSREWFSKRHKKLLEKLRTLLGFEGIVSMQ